MIILYFQRKICCDKLYELYFFVFFFFLNTILYTMHVHCRANCVHCYIATHLISYISIKLRAHTVILLDCIYKKKSSRASACHTLCICQSKSYIREAWYRRLSKPGAVIIDTKTISVIDSSENQLYIWTKFVIGYFTISILCGKRQNE